MNFLGEVLGERKEEIMVSSDVFVFVPQQGEGQPLVILEAMAAGLPVITCKTGAIEETIVEGQNGFFVEPGNPKQIADKILYLIENRDEISRIGENCRRRYESKYTLDIFIKNLKNVFNEVVSC